MDGSRFNGICDNVNKEILEEEIEKNNLDKKALIATIEERQRDKNETPQ